METMVPSIAALAVSGSAAIADWRTGEIANWITLPPAIAAPFLYAFFLGPLHGLLSVVALFLCALVPYGLFRQEAMGGGDVKLFSALGAVTAFDVRAGIEIELAALTIAMVIALGALAWKGALLRTLRNIARSSIRRLRSPSSLPAPDIESPTPIRLGGFIFVATVLVVAPYLGWPWIAA